MGWTSPKTWLETVLSILDLNTEIRDNFLFLKENIALETPAELTIASGLVTKTKSFHTIDTEGDASSDELDTINGGSAGDIILLMANNAAREVIIKDGTGNISCGGDIHLDTTGLIVPLIYDAVTAKWLTFDLYHSEHTFLVNQYTFPNPGTDWTPQLEGATLAQNKTAKILLIPLHFLKIGDEIISYKLIGDAIESNALTIDCKLVRINKANPLTTTDIPGGAIAQITVDGNFDVEAVLTAAEIVTTDKQYVLQITATTAGSDVVNLMGVEVVIARL